MSEFLRMGAEGPEKEVRELRQKKLGARSFLLHRLYTYLYSSVRPSRTLVFEEPLNLETAPPVILEPRIREAVGSLRVGVVRDSSPHPYYTKFARFLRNNGIPFEYVNIHGSRWVEDIKELGLILWVPGVAPWVLEEAREKIWFAEQCLHKWVYPSLAEVMFYENKAVQYAQLKHLGAPVIKTFISCDYDEARQWISTAQYPFVSKLKTGSASREVFLVRNPLHARLIVERVFRNGRPTGLPPHRQKNYVLFQEYVENHGYDLRIEVIDRDHIFGYYRDIPKGDFRASGFGDVVKTKLPAEAMKIALETAEALRFTNISLDFLRSTRDGRYYIIEASNFISIETDMQLMVGDRPGRYRYVDGCDEFVFEEGRYWVQALILSKLFTNRSFQRQTSAV